MVDTYDLFRKLGAGASFDRQRFGSYVIDQVHPTLKEKKCRPNSNEALDFFRDPDADLQSESKSKPTRDLDQKGKVVQNGNKIRTGKNAGNATRLKNDESDRENVKTVDHSDLKTTSKRSKKKRVSTDNDPSCIFESHGNSVKLLSGQNLHQNSKKRRAETLEEKAVYIHQEKVSTIRKKNRIHVSGADIPDPVETFDELTERYSLASSLTKNIFGEGYQNPTAVQMQVIPLMLNNRDILACAPTGSGKTLSFTIPILHLLKEPMKSGFRALILSPTRELTKQIYREFCVMNVGKNFKIHTLTKANASGNSFGTKSSQKFDILIATPKRIVHLLNQEPPAINLHNIEWLILDEGDKMFEDGKEGFREQVATIYQACDNSKIHRALFSATLANQVEHWCSIHLDNFVRVTVGIRNTATNTVKQELLFVGQEAGKLLAVRDIFQKGFDPPILIFVQSKERAKELYNELVYDGMNVDVIHADRTQAQRDDVVKSFRTGKMWVLIATELMSRGIDFKGVNLVVNYDFPSSTISYIHRIGRTGRAGRCGKAVTLFTEDDLVNLRSIANVMHAAGCEIPAWIFQLNKPSRKAKKKLLKVPVKRKPIKSISKFDMQKFKRKKQIIQDSKHKKDIKKQLINS